MRPRRIFTPAYHPRRWRPLAVGALALGAVAGVASLLPADMLGRAIALPADLFGGPPRQERVTAFPAEVRVLDGETMRVGDRLLRLAGVAAPARGQLCRDGAGRIFDCGAASAEALARLVADRPLDCRVTGRDRMGRDLATCRAAAEEVNAALVAAGWASPGTGATPAMTMLADAARQSGRGLWAAADPGLPLRADARP
jgi:endonuclease YncB( thermonuclease family)